MNNIKNENNYRRMIGRPQVQHDKVELSDNKIPICCEINSNLPDLTNKEPTIVMRNDVDYPKFSLGFTHWIHATKNKTDVFKTFANKKKVYQVVNGYERYIDDYNESIGTSSNKYFGLTDKKKPKILSRAFYKLWEILHFYDIVDANSKSFTSAHLAEGPGSFIQATMFYRELFSKHSKTDKYHAITIHGENEDENLLDLEKEFVDFYESENPQRFHMHKTYHSKISRASKSKDNGDLTKVKTITNFVKSVGSKVDLVTGDGGFDWTNENIQEQECAVLIFAQILTAVNIQKKGGSFVLKIFETFTTISLKFMMIVKHFYDNVYIVKPFTSRESNSEKYLVCKGFKYGENEQTELIKKLMNVLDDIDKMTEKTPKFLIDMFIDIQVPNDLITEMICINTMISNRQFEVINKMIEYLNGSNFHGETYTRYRDRQIELSKYWIDTFMSDKPKIEPKTLVEKGDKLFNKYVNTMKNELIFSNDLNNSKEKRKLSRSKTVKSKSRTKEKNIKKQKSKSLSKDNTIKKVVRKVKSSSKDKKQKSLSKDNTVKKAIRKVKSSSKDKKQKSLSKDNTVKKVVRKVKSSSKTK